jgi:signal transduction histidine kinase
VAGNWRAGTFVGMKRTIFAKIFLSTVVVFFVIGVIIAYLSITRTSKLLEDHLIEEGKTIAKIVAKEIEAGYLAHRWPFEMLAEVRGREVLFYWVVEPTGKIFLADDPKMWGLKIAEPSLGTKELIVKDGRHYPNGERIKLIVCPLKIGEPEKPWTLYLGVSRKSVVAAQKITIFKSIGVFFLSLAFAVLLSAALSSRIARPIRKLSSTALEIAKGKLDIRAKIKTGDEIEDLANSFNKMTAELQGLYATLEKKVQERTKELQKANKELKKTHEVLLSVNENLKEANKKLEAAYKKLKEADEMRKEFVSHTAHEIRTPLNVFRWSVEMLRGEDLGKINLRQREVLDQIYESNERLGALVSDLLEVARIDEARLKIVILPCQVEEIIDKAAGDLAVKIREERFNFVWKKTVPLVPKVRADKNRILQVLLNILDNAIKFTPAGGKIEVKISLVDKIAPQEVLKKYGFVQKDKQYVLISISDTGMGIPKAEQEKMFSRFFRGSNAQRAQIEGTGLGLAIVFEIIKMHNGAIWFESKENVGTTFYFTLPVILK